MFSNNHKRFYASVQGKFRRCKKIRQTGKYAVFSVFQFAGMPGLRRISRILTISADRLRASRLTID